MKRRISTSISTIAVLSLSLFVLIFCLTSCGFHLAGELTVTPKAEEMLTAISENRAEDAKAMMHPSYTEDANLGIEHMSGYLLGKEAEEMTAITFNISTSYGSDKVRHETATYQVRFTNGDIAHISVDHLSDSEGEGFLSFQLILGIS